MTAQVVIAARSGPDPKSRLAQILGLEDRAELVRMMLADMLAGLADCPNVGGVWVMTPDEDLAEVAGRMLARPVLQSGGGLNGAFLAGIAAARQAAPDAAVALLPGDLPLLEASEFQAALVTGEGHEVVLAAAAADGGTGAVILRAGLDWTPQFGTDSFAKHRALAEGRGLSLAVVRLPSLGWDLDRPDDVAEILRAGPQTRTAAFLNSRL